MSVDVFRASVEAGSAARQMRRASRAVLPVTNREMRTTLSSSLTRVFQVVAPVRSGRLRSKIASNMTGPASLETTSTAKSDAGYSYTGVTRLGHRVERIYPRTAKALKITLPGGQVILRASVKGYKPREDWATRGFRPAEQEVARAGERIGRAVVARL